MKLSTYHYYLRVPKKLFTEFRKEQKHKYKELMSYHISSISMRNRSYCYDELRKLRTNEGIFFEIKHDFYSFLEDKSFICMLEN